MSVSFIRFLTIVVVLGGCQATNSNQTNWTALTDKEARIRFGVEDILDLKRETKIRLKRSDQIREEFTTFRNSNGVVVAQIYVSELTAGFIYRAELEFESAKGVLTYAKSGDYSGLSSSSNLLGRVRYSEFERSGRSCVLIFQTFGENALHDLDYAGTARLVAYYCEHGLKALPTNRIQSVVRLIGYDNKRPSVSIEKSRHWNNLE